MQALRVAEMVTSMRAGEQERGRDQNQQPDNALATRGESAPRLSFSRSLMPSHLLTAWLLLAMFLLCITPLMDTDFWWHLRTGQLIWERGEVPRTDWYLFTDFDRPWIDLHWGFELLITALYSLGGVSLVTVVKACLLTTTVAISWFAVGKELPAWVRALIWIPAVICITGRGYERPEILSQLFLAMWLWIAFRVEVQPKWIWALPIIQVVWINCHALFVLGLVVGACYAVDYAIRKAAGGRFGLERVPETLKPLTVAAAGGACGLAAFVNPYFVEGALFPLVLYRKFSVEQEFYSARIGEFQRPIEFLLRHGFTNLYLDAQLLLFAVTVVSLFVLAYVAHKWSPFRWLLILGFGNLSWEASRNVNIFALVSTVVLVANVADLWRYFRTESTRDGERKFDSISTSLPLSDSRPMYGNLAVSALLAVWIGLIVTGVWGRTVGEKKPFGLGERPWWFAHDAIRFAGGPGLPDRAILSHIGLAGVYEFHHGPEKKVLTDPRLEVGRQETLKWQESILQSMARGDRSWELLLRDKDGRLPVVILDSRTSRPAINGLYATPGWRLVYADPAAAVFLPTKQADELHLEQADPTPLMYPP